MLLFSGDQQLPKSVLAVVRAYFGEVGEAELWSLAEVEAAERDARREGKEEEAGSSEGEGSGSSKRQRLE